MSAKELVLSGGLTRMRVNDLQDGDGQICLIVEANSKAGRTTPSMLAVLDRNDQHLLLLYLQERLARRS